MQRDGSRQHTKVTVDGECYSMLPLSIEFQEYQN